LERGIGTMLGYGIARFLAWSTPGHVDSNGDSEPDDWTS